jgi:hypothetical protein
MQLFDIMTILLLADFWQIQTSDRAKNTKNEFSTLELDTKLFFFTCAHKPPLKMRNL